jgi:hypothetical protein
MVDRRSRVAGATGMRVLVLSAAVIAMVVGCSSHSPALVGHAEAADEPGWARALGSGVTITAPAATKGGHGSPGAVVRGLFDLGMADLSAATCTYFPPASQPRCRASWASAPASTGVSVSHFALGYVATRGSEALVGSTGTFCGPGHDCISNANPAALFTQGKSFAALWKETMSQISSGKNSYLLYPCVRVSGRWYLYSPLGA